MPLLDGAIAVVTGGSSGIGAAAVTALQREGARVHILDLATSKPCNVTDPTQVADFFESLDTVHVLVNAAGVAIRHAVHEEEAEAWDHCLAVNLKGTFLASKHALPKMPSGSSVIHLSSVTGITGVRDRAAYSASKGAIIALTRNMALDYAPRQIRVNCICPGFVRTPLLDAILRDPERTARLTAMHPLGRLGEPADIANAVLFLASSQSSWMTGQALIIDGGFTAGHSGTI